MTRSDCKGVFFMSTISVRDRITDLFLWLLIAVSSAMFWFFWNSEETIITALPWQGYFFIGVSGFMLFYILYCSVGAYRYKMFPAQDDAELPGCTVIVPAYNEGRHVAETLFSLLESDYPAEKMEIIAVNDGSKDDTMQWIRYAESKSCGRIIAVDLPVNGGKKHALYKGFMMASHDIVVTVDSDSVVNADSLRNMVSSFASPDVGGAAGNIRIKNLSDGVIPKMMDVGFMFGFEIVRSAQSLIGYVMCTPGALSAYRKSLVMPFLDEWLHQTFMGVPANIGEDRAIASMILQHGYKVVFQRNAVAFTCIPHTYVKFCRMMLRWLRSDVRENYLMGCYFFKTLDRKVRKRFGFAMHLIALGFSTVMPLIILPVLIYMLCVFPLKELCCSLFYGTVLGFAGALIPAFIYAVRVSVLNAVWAPVYSVYSAFLLIWIPVYAFFTAGNSNWLTREIECKQKRIARCMCKR